MCKWCVILSKLMTLHFDELWHNVMNSFALSFFYVVSESYKLFNFIESKMLHSSQPLFTQLPNHSGGGAGPITQTNHPTCTMTEQQWRSSY